MDRSLKTTFEDFYYYFSKSNFSINIASICAKFLGYVPHSSPERSLSQNSDLGPG